MIDSACVTRVSPRFDRQDARVGAHSAGVIQAVEGVGRVPGVGKRDRPADGAPVDGGALEGPARVEGDDRAGGRGQGGDGERQKE